MSRVTIDRDGSVVFPTDPEPLTWADVDLLRETAERLFDTADMYGPGPASRLRDLADRIESLLPPREETPFTPEIRPADYTMPREETP